MCVCVCRCYVHIRHCALRLTHTRPLLILSYTPLQIQTGTRDLAFFSCTRVFRKAGRQAERSAGREAGRYRTAGKLSDMQADRQAVSYADKQTRAYKQLVLSRFASWHFHTYDYFLYPSFPVHSPSRHPLLFRKLVDGWRNEDQQLRVSIGLEKNLYRQTIENIGEYIRMRPNWCTLSPSCQVQQKPNCYFPSNKNASVTNTFHTCRASN